MAAPPPSQQPRRAYSLRSKQPPAAPVPPELLEFDPAVGPLPNAWARRNILRLEQLWDHHCGCFGVPTLPHCDKCDDRAAVCNCARQLYLAHIGSEQAFEEQKKRYKFDHTCVYYTKQVQELA